MKFIIGILSAFLMSSAMADNWTVGVAAGQEKITAPTPNTVTLVETKALYRFDNGILLGGSYQVGYPSDGVAIETRQEVLVGYGTRIGDFAPYALVGGGYRSKTTDHSIPFYDVTVGSKYFINQNYYVDANYRYRDSNSIVWQTGRTMVSVGRSVTKNAAVELGYAKVHGDYTSTQVGVAGVFKF
mgnify:CR=1 FL=1|jgi:hypothetical protein